MKIVTGLLVACTLGLASSAAERAQAAPPTTRPVPTSPSHRAPHFDGPMARRGRPQFGWQQMQDGDGRGNRDAQRPRQSASDESRAIADLTRQVQELTEQVKKLREATEKQARKDDRDDLPGPRGHSEWNQSDLGQPRGQANRWNDDRGPRLEPPSRDDGGRGRWMGQFNRRDDDRGPHTNRFNPFGWGHSDGRFGRGDEGRDRDAERPEQSEADHGDRFDHTPGNRGGHGDRYGQRDESRSPRGDRFTRPNDDRGRPADRSNHFNDERGGRFNRGHAEPDYREDRFSRSNVDHGHGTDGSNREGEARGSRVDRFNHADADRGGDRHNRGDVDRSGNGGRFDREEPAGNVSSRLSANRFGHGDDGRPPRGDRAGSDAKNTHQGEGRDKRSDDRSGPSDSHGRWRDRD